MRCADLRDELAGVALGESPSDDVRIHLRDCSACTEELARQRALVQRMDAAVNVSVREQPPAQLLASTLAAVRSSEQPRPWTLLWPRAAMGAALAVLVLCAVFGLRTLRSPATLGSDATQLTAWRSPTGMLLLPRGNVLDTPLRDRWFDLKTTTSHSQRSPGGTYGA